MEYMLSMFSMGVFAVTGVIATRHKNLDILSVVMLGSITALGGGTIRDIILGNYPIYWVNDLWYLWVSVSVSFIAFFIIKALSNRYQLLLYMDALGISLFSITAALKTTNLGYSPSIAVVMGIITAIFGGIMRDILSDSPCLLLSKELYATPVLAGLSIFVTLNHYLPNPALNVPLCIAMIFVMRSCAIFYKLELPKWFIARS